MNTDITQEPRYDEATCITAFQLRELGIKLSPEIPDVGWIQRAHVHYEVHGLVMDENEDGRLAADVSVTFTDVFRWISITAKIET